jgi:alanine racemase
MVRLGIGVYGVSNDPAEQKYLENVEPEISDFQIRIITAGESVDMVENSLRNLLMTIPIGYADGISRGWGNGAGFVTIKDKS